MKIAVKSILAGAAVVVAATIGAPMANAAGDQGSAVHTGSYGSQSAQREATKFEPATKTTRNWGPSQASSKDWSPSQFGK